MSAHFLLSSQSAPSPTTAAPLLGQAAQPGPGHAGRRPGNPSLGAHERGIINGLAAYQLRYAKPEEALHGAQSVGAVGVIFHVTHGEQHLAGNHRVLLKEPLVSGHQKSLAHRCSRLLRCEVLGTIAQLEKRCANSNGTGGH